MPLNGFISLFTFYLVFDEDNTLIDPARLLLELQQINCLNQSLSGCLEPKAIAKKITDGLVDKFDCSFARIWLVKPNKTELKLIASSGMYTRLNGEFATVAMGAYKVGKIAQNCIPFLSNSLPQETWVKDRQWAIDNKIRGFAGLPLVISDRAIGVLAIFSHQPMQAEFLEALRVLCNSLAVALNNAQIYQQLEKSENNAKELTINKPLSEQISEILTDISLILVGTERCLNFSTSYILLKTAEVLKTHKCNYCRLTYSDNFLSLEAMLLAELKILTGFQDLNLAITILNGNLQTDATRDNLIKIKLSLPYKERITVNSLLSQREKEVIQLLASGMRDREIAQKLFISDRTVKFHINNAVSKLDAKTRIQAVYRAYIKGFLSF